MSHIPDAGAFREQRKTAFFCCLFLYLGREDRKIDKMIPHSDPYVWDGKRSSNAFTLISMAEVNENEFA